jgi:hypothetical protein
MTQANVYAYDSTVDFPGEILETIEVADKVGGEDPIITATDGRVFRLAPHGKGVVPLDPPAAESSEG